MDPDTGSGASTNRSFMDTLASEKAAASEEEHKQQHDPIQQPRQHIGQPDDSDDEEEVVGHLDPQHPLMDRLQAALFRQLSQEDDRLELELREKREALTQAQTTVTSVGESLYQHQARLAKMQMDLQKTNQLQQEQEKARTTAELLLKERMVQYQEKMRQRQELEAKRIAAQRELDHLLITVQQIDDYNQKVKSEILVTRRAAYGTEESMQHLEKENSRAQTLIDGLNTQISNNEEQIRLYQAQIQNQKQETQQAQATLEEAAKEMELIAVEKREYLQKWRTSIVGMRNRDEALEAAYASADAQRQTLQNLELSLSGYKSAIRQEQIENEKLTAILNRVEAETRFMDQQLQAIADTKKNLNNKHTVLRASLERVESALKSALQTQREIRAEIDALHKAHEKLMSEKQEIDDTIMEHLNSQTTLEKGAQNVWKLTQKLKQQVHEKEIQMGEINNEVARIKVDTLNTGAHNKELQATLAAYDHELKEKDKLIEKYELEIRQRHDKIEKKQIYIARLNRKFETLTTNIQEENTGPLEATIANLSKEIIQTTREVSDMQREWIKSQTELVGLVSDTAEVDEHVTQQRARAVVLQQKHTRINNQFHSLKEEIKELEYGIKTMHHDLTTFNHQIATAVRRQEELANSNYTMEIDHMEKLKEREQETVKMNATTERLHQEYASLRDEIIAVEQEIMLWEKKIQLERETQEALDPEYGQPEIKGMKKEIHRMRLRLQQLKREQEKLIQQGEKTIMKRPMVSITRSTKANAQLTEAALQKEIQKIQNSLQEDSKAQEKVTYEIQQQMLACEELSAQLKRHQDQYGIIESRKIELQQEIQQQSLLAAVNDARVMVLQHHGQAHASEVKRALASSSDQGEVKRKSNVKEKKEKIATPANEQEKLAQLQRQQQQYEAALAREQSRFESLQHLISSQCDPENNPKYHEWFKRLYAQIPNLNT